MSRKLLLEKEMKLRNKKTGAIYRIGDIDLSNTRDGIWLGLTKYTSLAELNENWEDVEEPKEYYFIRSESLTVGYSPISNTRSCRNRKEIGNYFETKEEAENALEKLKAWKRLKDKGFEFCGYEALGCGEIHFTSDWDIEDEYEKGQRKKDLDLLFGGEE